MSEMVAYTTMSGWLTFRFFLAFEVDRWQCYVVDGPSWEAFSAELVPMGMNPPGCARVNGNFKIRWFDMARISSTGQAKTLASIWAETLESFLQTGKWRITYETNDSASRFTFSIERGPGSFRIYIESQPEYGSRDEGSHPTHRIFDGERTYICWDGSIDDWEAAEDIATCWAEKTRSYILLGTRF